MGFWEWVKTNVYFWIALGIIFVYVLSGANFSTPKMMGRSFGEFLRLGGALLLGFYVGYRVNKKEKEEESSENQETEKTE